MRLLRGVGWSNHQVGKQDVQTGRRWWGGTEAMETEVAISLHGSIREKTAQVRKYERKEGGRNHVSCYNFLIQIIILIIPIIKNNLSYSIKLLHSMQWGIFRTTWGKETSFSPTHKIFPSKFFCTILWCLSWSYVSGFDLWKKIYSLILHSFSLGGNWSRTKPVLLVKCIVSKPQDLCVHPKW